MNTILKKLLTVLVCAGAGIASGQSAATFVSAMLGSAAILCVVLFSPRWNANAREQSAADA